MTSSGGCFLGSVTCQKCGQVRFPQSYTLPFTCQKCREAEHAPQGEAVRLFEPAPNQVPGQTVMDDGSTCPARNVVFYLLRSGE